MNSQEIFTKVKTHLLAQNEKSRAEYSTHCMYRGTHGSKCAVGCLIPDELYDSDIENGNVTRIIEVEPQLKCILPDDKDAAEGEFFLNKLQRVHDLYDPVDWSLCLKQFAENHNLTY